MYVGLNEYEAAWTQLKRETISHSTCKIVLFVSCLDVDALCAAKVLSRLLQKDLIPHKIIPTVGYQNLRDDFQTLDDDITNVICIGCGSNVDLQEYLGIPAEEKPKVKVHIFDNHRPWNLSNLFGSNAIICYDDGPKDSLSKYKVAYEYLAENDEASDEEDDKEEVAESEYSVRSDTGSENDAKETQSEESTSFAGQMQDGTDDTPAPGHEPANANSSVDLVAGAVLAGPEPTQMDTKERSISDEGTYQAKKRKTLRHTYATQLTEYHSQGSYLGTSDTINVYALLTVIGETSARSLWLTILGVTALEPQYPEVYTTLYPILKGEINRLGHGRGIKSTGNSSTDTSFAVETDYSFFLLRQWSLYDSMVHSSYLSAKLYLWTDDGRKNLHKLLAKMGISLQEAREQWVYVSPPLKRSLKSKLETVTGMYGIESIVRDGIVRKFGYKGTLSAGDCAESLAALLEAGNRTVGAIEGCPPPPSARDAGGLSYGSQQAGVTQAERHQFWVENFWVAWDAAENFDKLLSGMARAKVLQQAVVSTGTAVFEKGQLKDLHSFRLAVIRDGPDIEIFRNPLSLARLGVWISEGCAEIHANPLPLVIACFDAANDRYLVLGMGPRKSREEAALDTVYNKFGQAFQETGTLINASISIDAFESAIIEVARDDLSRFLEALATEMRKTAY